jgi:hypothetical protein
MIECTILHFILKYSFYIFLSERIDALHDRQYVNFFDGCKKLWASTCGSFLSKPTIDALLL